MSMRHHIGQDPSGKPADKPSILGRKSGSRRQFRRWGRNGALSLALLATACSGGSARYAGELYSLDNFYGGIVADEPRAALVGRQVLAAGGNAVDALVAAYFVMSATMPSTAGLGGGGVCVVHRGEEDKIADEVLDFLPRAAAGGLVAVPGSARGMAALQAKFGKLPWAQLVAPAETIAQGGEAASRALARDVMLGEKKLRADPAMAALFTRADGGMLGEGDNLRQSELAGVLGQIRAKGPQELYGGLVGQQLVAAAQSIGAPLTIEDLRNYQVQVYEPLQIKWGDQLVFLPKPTELGGAAGGISVAQMLVALSQYSSGNRAVFLAEASWRLVADRAQWMQPDGKVTQPVEGLIAADHVAQVLQGAPGGGGLPENPFSAGIVAADAEGLGVACNFTMNALFGAGRIAPGTGIILAPAPDERGFGFSALAPMVMANRNNGEFYYASAASGGLAGALAEADLLHAVTQEKLSLEAAMLRPRVFHDGDPDLAIYDVSGNDDPSAALTAAGFQVEQRNGIGRVNAIWCPGGSPTDPESCQLRNDFRGNGLASFVTKD
jgi:gamma-glutamyltranspeptidase/glutathione hydrolase